MELTENLTGENITDILDEEVDITEVEQSTSINMNDFKVDSFELSTEEKNPTEEKKESKSATTPPVQKNEAIARAAKPSIMVAFADIMLVRLGAAFSKKPKEYWRLSGEDKEDLTLLLGETIKEGDFTGIPSKWLLIGVVVLIIIAKVMNMNDKNYTGETKKIDTDYESIRIQAETRYKASQEFNILNDTIEALKEQNKMLVKMMKDIENKVENTNASTSQIVDATIVSQQKNLKINKIFRGYDLSKIDFTRNKSLIDPSKAGEQGYTDKGKKLGRISLEQEEVYKQWVLYKNEFKADLNKEIFQTA